MLTSDLVRARVKGSAVEPSLVDPAAPGLREVAEALVELFTQAADEGWTRGEVQQGIDDLVEARPDHKTVRGMAKVVLDRAEFEVRSPMPPSELRDRVFRAAAARRPLALEAGPLGRPTAADVLTDEAAALDLDPKALLEALYADHPDAQRLTALKVPGVDRLIDRYNVGLVQAVLLRATGVQVRLVGPSVPRARQLFRAIKFHQLIHHATRDGDALVVTLDGPTSLFRQSTRYGLQLATFFPALLLQECPWTLEAEVLWTRAKHRKTMSLDDTCGLRSHYRDVGAYPTRTQKWFAERFDALESGWKRTDRTRVIDLAGRAVLLPDFRFEKDGRTAFLEIVGYWRRDWLQRRVELLNRHGPGNLVLAVSRKLRGSKEQMPEFAGAVIEFAKVVPARDVLAAIEAVAR